MEPFAYSAGYYPQIYSHAEWEKDLDTMQQCGIVVVRVAELFYSWDEMEPSRGVYDFKKLDEFFDACAQRGMKILLGTGTASPPYWLHQQDPDMNLLSASGKRFPNNAAYSWACFHNPTYRDACDRYVTTLVEHYRSHPALFAYQIHNEIGLPFMSPDGTAIEMYCYCDHSKQAFRRWVQQKYKTLDNLNHAWFWSTTTTHHTDWQMVEPPYTKPTAWSSVTRFLDFRLFMMDTITEFVQQQAQLLRQLDPHHPTSTNIFYLKGEDKLGVMTAIDQFAIAWQVDMLGYDLYPGSGNKHEDRPEFSSMFLDHGRSAAKFAGKPFWLMEVESGPINGWALGPNRSTDGTDIVRYILDAVGHNAKMTMYQGFRQWDFQPLNWGGLVDLDGNPTERTGAAAKMGDFVAKNSEFLKAARPYPSQVAVLTSRDSNIIANGMGHETFMIDALRSSYSILWEKGFEIDFITPGQLEAHAADYQMICAPFMLSLSSTNCNALADYVRKGGILLGEPRIGYVNEMGWYHHKQPPLDLGAVFGVTQKGIDSNVKSKVTYRGANYDGYWHKEHLEVQSQTQVLASFFDDTPAVTSNPYGQGLGLYVATYASQAYLKNGSMLLWNVLDDVFAARKIVPKVTIAYTNRIDREIDGHLLTDGKRDLLIITSYLKDGRDDFFIGRHKQITVTLQGHYHKVVDAFTGEPLASSIEHETTVIRYPMHKRENMAWYLEPLPERSGQHGSNRE